MQYSAGYISKGEVFHLLMGEDNKRNGITWQAEEENVFLRDK
jgi:hypothetical protein